MLDVMGSLLTVGNVVRRIESAQQTASSSTRLMCSPSNFTYFCQITDIKGRLNELLYVYPLPIALTQSREIRYCLRHKGSLCVNIDGNCSSVSGWVYFTALVRGGYVVLDWSSACMNIANNQNIHEIHRQLDLFQNDAQQLL
ncbi:hypothetical protein KIN20_028774 [Parelaphostrongylus tenuis]|uniref:Uncharacterized protein n=1 Tax=Parelaphostrongylus tenuis TaxID=148309 RepID=A0AAD5R227_PARTN|nr:hypothetical protein KIN20_028774 [Parelaphostrongylus tenuis]